MSAGHHPHPHQRHAQPQTNAAHGAANAQARPRGSGTATHFYFERQWNAPAVKILPGEYFVSEEEVVITTVLGSCVSACIWDRTTGIGGMNHFMLPETGEADFTGAAGRFGTYAMELLINDLMKKGARRENLDAKLFGGGNVMKNFTTINVGERNAAFAEKFLQTERIRCSAKDLLDIYPRKVVFFSHSGKCMVKKLKEDRGETVVKLESQYKSKLQVAKPAVTGGDIELF